jgi:hypothetical protein
MKQKEMTTYSSLEESQCFSELTDIAGQQSSQHKSLTANMLGREPCSESRISRQMILSEVRRVFASKAHANAKDVSILTCRAEAAIPRVLGHDSINAQQFLFFFPADLLSILNFSISSVTLSEFSSYISFTASHSIETKRMRDS